MEKQDRVLTTAEVDRLLEQPDFFALGQGMSHLGLRRFSHEGKISRLLHDHMDAVLFHIMPKAVLSGERKDRRTREQAMAALLHCYELASEHADIIGWKIIMTNVIEYTQQRKQHYDNIDRKFVETVKELLGNIRLLPADQCTPQNYSAFMDQSTRAAAVVHDALDLTLRHHMMAVYYGTEPDAYASEEYRADALLEAQQPNTVRALMYQPDETISPTNNRVLDELLARCIKKIPRIEPGLLLSASNATDHPRHHDAVRIIRKLFYGAPIDQVLANIRTEGLLAQLRFIIGPLADELFNEFKNCPPGSFSHRYRLNTRLDKVDPSIGLYLPISVLDREHQQRLVSYRTIDNVPEPLLHLPEITPERLKILTELNKAMAKDITETTVAIRPACIDVRWVNQFGVIEVTVQPDQDHFPAVNFFIAGEDWLVTGRLNEELDIELPNGIDPEKKSMYEMMRGYTLAILHDQLPAATKQAASRRVHHTANNFIVLTQAAEDPDQIKVNPGKTDETVTLTIDRRAHWNDLAPQLTLTARQEALEQLIQEDIIEPTDDNNRAIDVLRQLLTAPNSHRLSIARIFQDALAREQRGQKLLPPTFPVFAVQERLQQLTEERYDKKLQDYLGSQPVGPRPRIYTIGQRIEADHISRKSGAVLPPRQLMTQTYMPADHYECTIPLRSGVAQQRGYVVMRGRSAVDALEKLLNPVQ